MDDEERLRRGHEADMILTSPMFTEACNKVETAMMKTWLESDPDNTTVRERAFHQVRALGELLKYLTSQMRTGRMTEMRIEQQQTRADGPTGSGA